MDYLEITIHPVSKWVAPDTKQATCGHERNYAVRVGKEFKYLCQVCVDKIQAILNSNG
jgi:hypothetical protein